MKPKFKIHDPVKKADLKRTCSKGDTTKWLNEFHTLTETIKDTIPSYRIGKLPEPYNEALLKKTNLTMKENDNVVKTLGLIGQLHIQR